MVHALIGGKGFETKAPFDVYTCTMSAKARLTLCEPHLLKCLLELDRCTIIIYILAIQAWESKIPLFFFWEVF